MAVADRVGFDRRGTPLFRRGPDGEEILREAVETEQIRLGGKIIRRTLRRMERILDDDLPHIGERYADFRREHPEPR